MGRDSNIQAIAMPPRRSDLPSVSIDHSSGLPAARKRGIRWLYDPLHIMWSTFAMVALILTIWSTMVVQRLGHLKRTPLSAADFAMASTTIRYFDGANTAANNLRNLFGMPMPFFAIIPLLTGTRQAGIAQVLLAWKFVLLRAAHSRVHIGKGSLQARFRLCFASAIILSAM